MLHHSFEGVHADNEVAASIQEAARDIEPAIHPDTLFNLCKEDSQLRALCETVFEYCTKYAHDVFAMEQQLLEDEDKRMSGNYSEEDFQNIKEIDERRHRLHTALNDSINILIRNMIAKNVIESDEPWAHEVTSNGRASRAHFALLTFCKRATSGKPF